MPDKYYYLVSSLPHLEFGKMPPLTIDDFISECEKWLSTGDLEEIKAIDVQDRNAEGRGTSVLKIWNEFYDELRRDLALARRAKKDTAHESIPDSVAGIFREPTPLIMEREIERIKWDFLEEQESGHNFDLEILEIYFLKLGILTRLSYFDREKGKAAFETICKSK